MKKLVISLTVLVVLLVFMIGSVSAKPEAKVAICHLNGQGVYSPIYVSENSLDVHLDHGDGIVGVHADASCQPFIEPVCMVDQYDKQWDLNWNELTGELVGAVYPLGWGVSGWVTPRDLFETGVDSVVDLTAANPNANGCTLPPVGADYFTQIGTRQIGTNDFAGTWTNYCNDSPAGSGQWSGTFSAGACGS